jgi:photosystem II stability/assembly factor-like uncharacterized protein
VARLVALVACVAAVAATTALSSRSSVEAWYPAHATLLSPTFGYAVAARADGGGGLYLYRAGRWMLSAAQTDGGIEDVAFPDEAHGWIATYDGGRALVSVYRTADGGRSWRRLGIRATHSPGGGPTYLSFPNTRDGWLEPVSPNGPAGALYRTANGGSIWHLVGGALGEGGASACLNRITAVSATAAWMPCARLLRTVDGGGTWHPQALPLPARWRQHATASAGDPRFFGDDGIVPVTVSSHHGKAVLFYATQNAGRTWKLVAAHPTGGFCDRSFLWPSDPRATVSIASLTAWWVASGRHGRIDVTTDGGRRWSSHASNLTRWCEISNLTAGSAALAWVTRRVGRGAPLYETRDGGRTWRPVVLPLR